MTTPQPPERTEKRPAHPADYEPEDRESVVAILGNASRSGDWEPPERVTAVGGLGSVVLDFRKADLPPGVTEVNAIAILGSVEIRVPEGLEIEVNGFSFLGSLEHRSARKSLGRRLRDLRGAAAVPGEADPIAEAPFLSVRGTAILGNVTVRIS